MPRGRNAVKTSTDRMLTTHIGSLPRPPALLAAMRAHEAGQSNGAYASTLRAAVADVVKRQVALGLDIIDDGEFSKPGFIHYINTRLGGFEPSHSPGGDPFGGSRERLAFPEFYAEFNASMPPNPTASAMHMVCTGPITYKGQQEIQTDIENMKAAAAGLSVEDIFVPAISPTSVEYWQSNDYYKTQEEYLFAIAEALHDEYKAITDAGFIVQIDDPHMSMYHVMNPATTIESIRAWAAVRVDAINHALRGIPREQVRWHTCYGINIGPRVHDLELKHFLDLILRIDAGAYSFEAANPRHEHEWKLWETTKLPEGSVLIPGVITQSSVLVEHPELVAQRIARFASVVGKENVIAGADCGFGTFAGLNEIHESVAWAKLEALAQGAKLATKELWG
jgi:5-methyltetrahydropteroyltriglutamate--homocysteine methyltransferase